MVLGGAASVTYDFVIDFIKHVNCGISLRGSEEADVRIKMSTNLKNSLQFFTETGHF
jgi:hypothetical protein